MLSATIGEGGGDSDGLQDVVLEDVDTMEQSSSVTN